MSASTWLVILAAAVLNRVRGGGFFGDRLPGHPRFWVAPLMGGLAAVHHPPLAAAALGAAWLYWSLLPWGRWYTFGAVTPDRPPTTFEAAVEVLAGDDHVLAFSIRNTIAFAPIWLVHPWAWLAGWVQTALYAFAKAVAPPAIFVPVAEILTGALWGLLLILT
ncbi:hypothetical protein [uncultured Alsobacter sp.]|uniref:hypothetical protein n=1 Tax=uncultured Alsobacter sp. TaxID=1748258 RepID=UPI0025D51371|nr:hypothetical protein [uncultured Alsobacter sp.]